MSVRTLLVFLHLLACLALLLAVGLVAMNVVYSSRRSQRGEGRPPIPILVTVLGLMALRALSLTLHRPGLFGFWPIVLVLLADVGSWLLPPIVCEMLGLADSKRPVVVPPPSEPRAKDAPPRPAVPPFEPRPRQLGEPSPFAKKPPPQSPPR
jgi:hypothetical protein